MQFIVTGYDYKDDKALERRLAARDAHLEMADKMSKEGKWLYAAALLTEDGKMCGSVIICDFCVATIHYCITSKNSFFSLSILCTRFSIFSAADPR